MDQQQVRSFFEESADVLITFATTYSTLVLEVWEVIVQTFKKWNKLFIAGNGWSAADAQHRAAELTGRYKSERQSLPGIALTTDSSALTAIGNDFGFEYIFSKQLAGLGQEGDMFVGISTSGNSPNIIEAVQVAKTKKMTTLLLLGKDGWKLKGMGDLEFIVPSNDTAKIQQCHQALYHTLCQIIDDAFTP